MEEKGTKDKKRLATEHTGGFMKTRNILISAILAILMSISSAKAEEIRIMEVTEQTIAASAAKTESVMGNETPMHDDGHMKDEKGHKHDEEGMHGMMMGHHMVGWGIVIGVVMIAMMVGHLIVIAR